MLFTCDKMWDIKKNHGNDNPFVDTHFAIFPVKLLSGKCAWLQRVQRIRWWHTYLDDSVSDWAHTTYAEL